MKNIAVSFGGNQNRTVSFTWVGDFSPSPDFVTKIYYQYRWGWTGLCFASLRFYKRNSFGGNNPLRVYLLLNFNYGGKRKDDIGDYEKADRYLIEWISGFRFFIMIQGIADGEKVRIKTVIDLNPWLGVN